MAILKSAKQIECLIPEVNEHFYMSMITYAPENIIKENVIFAFVVDSKTNEIKQKFRTILSLFSVEKSYYLFFNTYDREIKKDSYYISAKLKENENLTIDKWNFQVDDIGLHVVSSNISKDIIYFGTNCDDDRDIRSELVKRKRKQTIKTEVVYAY